MFHSKANVVIKKLSQPRKFIIDTDAGVDDALAILLALKYEETHADDFKIMAITCTQGNTNEKNVAKNVLKILTVAKRNDVSNVLGRQITNYYIKYSRIALEKVNIIYFQDSSL